MNATEVKTQLHNYIEQADQTFLRIVHVMFKQYFEEHEQQEQSRAQELIQKINQGLSIEEKTRLDLLNTKRKANTINSEEQIELLQLVEKVELFTANRVIYMTELAQLRNTDIRTILKDFPFQKSSHV